MKRYSFIIPLLLFLAFFLPQASTKAYSNLIQNGGFEDGGNHWDGGNCCISSTYAHSGSYALAWVSTGAADIIQWNMPITPGTTYTVSYWFYRVSGELGYAKDDYTGIHTPQGNYDTWQHFQYTFSSDGYQVFYIEFQGNNGIGMYVDDVELIQTDPPTTTPTNTETPTNTGTATFTSTATNTATNTFTPSNTPTITPTFTQTFTPTDTQINMTVIPSYTPTLTPTPTQVNTRSPGSNITWINVGEINNDLLNGLTSYLLSNPPDGENGTIYTVTDQQAQGDGTYIISIANVTAAPPDYAWGLDSGGFAWLGSLDCQDRGSWTCTLYSPPLPIQSQGSESGLILPWKAGYSAIYGVSGVHGENSGWLPGSRAVDFVGGDNLGSSIMPPYAYAAASGTVVFTCHGTNDTSIIVDSGYGKLMYAHLNKNDGNLQNGLQVHAGQVISSLTYGTFSGGPCGTWASQQANQYHLHFAFIPSNGYFLIGNCQLNISSQNWVCGSLTYGIGSRIPNGGGSGPGPTQTPGGPTATPCVEGCTQPQGGGDHIWDGLVGGVIDIINYLAKNVLTPYQPSGMASSFTNLIDQLGDVAMLIAASQMLSIVPAVVCYGFILSAELIRIVVVAWRWILRLVPMAG